MTPLTDSTAQLNDTEALQAQAQAEGYVLVRELLPASDVEMGEAGDGEAAVALENITLKHRDPGRRARAAAALENLRES